MTSSDDLSVYLFAYGLFLRMWHVTLDPSRTRKRVGPGVFPERLDDGGRSGRCLACTERCW